MNNYITKRLEEFEKEFGHEHNGIGTNQNIVKTGTDMAELKSFIATSIHQAVAEERARVVKVEEKYQELIMAVEKKYEGETRHETALKYIKRAENNDYEIAGKSSLDKPDKQNWQLCIHSRKDVNKPLTDNKDI